MFNCFLLNYPSALHKFENKAFFGKIIKEGKDMNFLWDYCEGNETTIRKMIFGTPEDIKIL